jgi:hypothetical protein
MIVLSWYSNRFFNIDQMNSAVSGVSIVILSWEAILNSRKDSVEICSEMYFPFLSVRSMADFFLVLFLTGPRLISKMRFLIFDSAIDEIREQTRVKPWDNVLEDQKCGR